jgi:hypothetical protein
MRVAGFRGHRPASATVMAQCVDEVVVAGTHVALLLHDRSVLAVMDRVPAATAAELLAAEQVRLEQASQVVAQSEQAARAGVLVRSFASSRVASLAWEGGAASANVRLTAVLRDGGLHWWDWDVAKQVWAAGQSKKLVTLAAGEEIESAVADPTVAGSWLCLESSVGTNELALWRRNGAAAAVLIARVPGDGERVRLWASKDPVATAWISSEYGGLCSVDLGDPNPFCPPTFFRNCLIEQHPVTQEMVLLDEGKVYVLRHNASPRLLCALSSALAGLVGMAFLHRTLLVLDDHGARCSVFDLGTGLLLRSNVTPPGLRLARQGLESPIAVLWGASIGFQTLQHEAVAQVQALLPADRGAQLAQEWGLRRLAAWRLLSDGKDPAAVAAFTATPALSVAMAGGADDARLIEMARKHLASDTPKHAFESLSTLTPQVSPLLRQWAEAQPVSLQYPDLSEQEALEVRAMEQPDAVLDELLVSSSEESPAWKFCLTCRLLLELRPEELPGFVGREKNARRVQLAADCLAVASPQKRSDAQVRAAARVLELAGNASASARLLIANGLPQTQDVRLAFAEALRRGDEETLTRLWADCDLEDGALFRMLHVYGEDEKNLTVGLLKNIMAARK